MIKCCVIMDIFCHIHFATISSTISKCKWQIWGILKILWTLLQLLGIRRSLAAAIWPRFYIVVICCTLILVCFPGSYSPKVKMNFTKSNFSNRVQSYCKLCCISIWSELTLVILWQYCYIVCYLISFLLVCLLEFQWRSMKRKEKKS